MSPRITFRNKLLDLVRQIEGFSEDNTSLYKLDIVERTPHATVHLNRLNNEVLTMTRQGNESERTLTAFVDFHLDHTEDADAKMDEWLTKLEKLVHIAAQRGEFGEGMRTVYLQSADFRPTETSKQKRGDLVTEWATEYTEFVATE